MKINDISKFYPIEKTDNDPTDKASRKEGDFSGLLNHEMDMATSSPIQVSHSQMRIEGVSGPSFMHNTPASENESLLADSVNSALVQLEQLQEHIYSSDATPRAINNTLSSLLDKAGSLTEELKLLPDDHPLRQIGNELSILAHVESLKWQRGEYL